MVFSKSVASYIAEPSKENPEDFSMEKARQKVEEIHGKDCTIISEMISTGKSIAFKFAVYEQI